MLWGMFCVGMATWSNCIGCLWGDCSPLVVQASRLHPEYAGGTPAPQLLPQVRVDAGHLGEVGVGVPLHFKSTDRLRPRASRAFAGEDGVRSIGATGDDDAR